MKKIEKKNLSVLFEALAAKAALYIPADNAAGQSQFTRYEAGMTLSEKLNTARSPKDLFFPQIENLADFQVSGKEIRVQERKAPEEAFILFGVRGCDCKSFEILDKVFLSEPADGYYAARRSHGIVMTLACGAPEETCFCGVFGIDPAAPGGDVSCYFAEDALFLQPLTSKGEALLEGIALEEAGDEAVEAEKTSIRRIADRLPLNQLSTEAFGGDKTRALFDRPEWDDLAKSCIGCGTCTFVCPTCQCYDVKEFKAGDNVQRFRCWDSCMYSDFTMMSAGQPRPTQKERFRQRFMHKLVYYPANNEGLFSCVGCGRCVAKCPIHMNIAKVMKTLGGAQNEK